MSPDARARLEEWVAGYERAWRTAGTSTLAGLFHPEATYRTAPFEDPYRGLEAIAALWEEERESHDESFSMDSEIVAVEGDTGVVRAEVRYDGPPERTYRDLWIVTFDPKGLCTCFEEWPFWPTGTEGTFAPGPGR